MLAHLERGRQKLKINISHTKNTLIGWDIDVKVDAEGTEKISDVEVRVNGFPEIRDSPGNLSSWEQQLTQKGVFPGNNTVNVRVTDQNGNDTNAKQSWS
jgi:hypothetical protein